MAASRDVPNGRAVSQHRLPVSLAASSLPSRQSYLRVHSHSVSLGAGNPASRVNRRKSSAAVNPINLAALTAAVKEISSGSGEASYKNVDGAVISKSPKGSGSSRPVSSASAVPGGSAVVDGPPLSSLLGGSRPGGKPRNRRASEGSRVGKERSKSNVGELRCETCGKGYKHGSCLTKHLWEHTPEWALTSKLLISKHQQVQLLEAASVLVQMNSDGSGPALISHPEDDHSSASPAASGSSDPIDEDDLSSRTSTPSQVDETSKPSFGRRGRQDSYSDAFSRSYQSSSFAASSIPNESHGFAMYRQWSSSSRPSTAHGQSDDEQTDLTAAAQGLVNCSLGTPKSGPRQLPSGIPPVPPLPAKFLRQRGSMEMDVDEDDEGVFGTMEQ